MNHDYTGHLDKLVFDGIEIKGHVSDIILGLKELSGKLDTLIALQQVEVSLLQQRQEPQQQKAPR
jgi:hypothetical protein